MASLRARLGLLGFTALSMGVAANIMLMQPGSRSAALRDGQLAAARELTDIARGQPKAQAAPASRSPAAAPSRAEGETQPETVRAIQRELQSRGYETGGQDGVPGLVTRAAILAYEIDNGLPPTADPTDQLLRAIVLGSAGRDMSATAGDRRTHVEHIVRTVQHSLAGLKYFNAKPDGRLGDDTRRAIREFEQDQGLRVTGRISGELVVRLAKAAVSGRLGHAK